jgi:DNA polymerase-3 subunit epsilon
VTEFVAIDLETANSNMASICQIGIVKYQHGEVIEEWTEYINPEEHFDKINISVHGITKDDISKAPKLPEVFEKISELLSNTICVSHTHFDRVSINKALQKYSIPQLETQWCSI